MIVRRLQKVGTGTTAYYDITGGHGLLNFAVDDEAIAQAIRCDLQLILGEWFLDTTKGIPWIRNPNADTKTILGRLPADLPYAETTIKAAILRVANGIRLDSFALDFNHQTRAASCSISGRLPSGQPFTISEAVL